MSYKVIADVADSAALARREAACAAQELNTTDAAGWVRMYGLVLAAQPGWADAWAYAEASHPGEDHGDDEAVITDGMILSAVQTIAGIV